MTKTQWFIIGALGIGVLVVCCCGALATIGILSSRQTTTNSIPGDSSTNGNVPATSPKSSEPALTYADITSAAKQLTEIKRNDYYKTLIGKQISDSGKIADVSAGGEVHVRIVTSVSYEIKMQGVPMAKASGLNLNDRVQFSGTITNVSDLFGSGSPILTVKYLSIGAQ